MELSCRPHHEYQLPEITLSLPTGATFDKEYNEMGTYYSG
jgi:hypothetical protein